MLARVVQGGCHTIGPVRNDAIGAHGMGEMEVGEGGQALCGHMGMFAMR